MSFWKIAWRNIQQRGLASALTALSMALGVAVMIAVIVIYAVAVRQFDQNAQGYNLIVGGKGGSLQLVLSTVYHIGQPLYPIPYTYYQKFEPGGEFGDSVAVAIPQCLGDSYEAPNGAMFRVVATTPDLFDKIEYGRQSDGTPLRYEFQNGGRNLRDASHLSGHAFHESAFEAVVGSVVASQAGVKLGDEIQPTHGIGGDGHKHDGFKVVGVLEPTGTANDRAVFINIEGFYRLEGHALAEEAEHAAVAAVAVPEKHEHADEHAKDAHHDEHDHDHDHAKADAHDHHHDAKDAKGEHAAEAHDDHDHDHAKADDHDHAEPATKDHAHDEHDHDHDADAAKHDEEHAAEHKDDHEPHDAAAHDEHDHKEGEHKDDAHAAEAKAPAAAEPHDEHEKNAHDHDHDAAKADDHDHAKHAADDHEKDGHAKDEHAHDDHAAGAHAHDEHGHDHHHHGHIDEPLPIDQREVTSILVLCKDNPLLARGLDMGINKGKDGIAQAVAPTREVAMLMNSIVGPIRLVLLVLTILVVIVAGISILVSIYNSMNERSHDIAVMRALGASRNAVMGIILVESILLSLGGGLIGVLLGHGLIGLASPYVVERTGILLSLFEFDWQELILIPGLMILASLVGFLPALAAYRTDVAKALSGSR